MLGTLAIVVFISSIIVFFSQELKATTMRTLNNRGFQLMMPILVCSYLCVKFEWQVLWLMNACRILLFYIVYFFSLFIPHSPRGIYIERILTLILLSCLPLGLATLIETYCKPLAGKLKGTTLQITIFVWAVSALLFTIGMRF